MGIHSRQAREEATTAVRVEERRGMNAEAGDEKVVRRKIKLIHD